MLLKLSQHQKAPNSITDQISASKPATFRRRKTKPLYKSLIYQNLHSLLSVQYPESTIHSLTRYSHKSSILTELQSLQISCLQSQRKLYSCRILFYIRSSQCISLQSLQNILHSKAAITLSPSLPVPVWHPAISWSDDLGHSATKNPNKLARENPET